MRDLYEQVYAILSEARHRATRSVNVEMVRAYWLVGQAIVEQEQQGKGRADYGEHLVEALAERLTEEFGKGFQSRNLWWMREFYLKFPILNAVRSELTWTHYRLLFRVENPEARAFYETEAADQSWSTRQLERQIASLFYERAALSKRKRGGLSLSLRPGTRGRGAVEETIHTEMLVHLWPVRNMTGADDLAVMALPAGGLFEPPGPPQRHTDGAAIRKVGGDGGVGYRDSCEARISLSGRSRLCLISGCSAHSMPP